MLRTGCGDDGMKVLVYLFLLLLILSSFNGLITVYATNGDWLGGFKSIVGKSELTLLAVTKSGKALVGTTMELKVVVTKGTGRVFLAVEPIAELDLQTSAKLAALVAANALGKDFMNYNYFIMLSSNAQVVGGPSAGAAMAVAIAAALSGKGYLLNKSVAITGVIMPDSTVGPVGGLPEKIEAAGEEGVKLVLMPKGQLIVKDPVTNKTVNVMNIARKYGMKLIEVGDIYEALKVLGILPHVALYSVKTIEIPESVNNIMKLWVRDFNRTYPRLLNEVNELLMKLNKSLLINNFNVSLLKLIINLTKEGRSLYSIALKEFNSGNYYAAASDMFGAVVDLDRVRWIIKVISSNNVSRELSELLNYAEESVDNASKTLKVLENKLLSEGSIDISKLSVIIEVSKRVYEARTLLNQLRNEVINITATNRAKSRSEVLPKLLNFVSEAVYTYWRGGSAVAWSKLIDAVPKSNLSVSRLGIEESATLLTHYSQVSTSYIGTFLSSRYKFFVNELSSEVRDASRYLSNDSVMALAICMSALARVAAALNTMFSLNYTSKALMLREEVLKAIARAEHLGMFPLVALTYLERGDSVLRMDPISAIYFYDLALTNTVWYLLMAKQVNVGPGISESLTSTQPYLASVSAVKHLITYLATLVLGIVIGSVITYYLTLKRRQVRSS